MIILLKAVPNRIKMQEYKWENCCNEMPIPYIYVKDKLKEEVDVTANTLKLTLPGKVKLLHMSKRPLMTPSRST